MKNIRFILSDAFTSLIPKKTLCGISGLTEKERENYREELLDNIRLVGSQKLLGYLPLSTIKEICLKSPLEMKKNAEEKGLQALLFKENEVRISSGALYVYDSVKLQQFLLLDQNKKVLERNNWPTDVHKFVGQVTTVIATDNKLYDLIALTFNDERYQSYKTQKQGPTPWSPQ